jgi:hypothetical protein
VKVDNRYECLSEIGNVEDEWFKFKNGVVESVVVLFSKGER